MTLRDCCVVYATGNVRAPNKLQASKQILGQLVKELVNFHNAQLTTGLMEAL